MCEGDELCVQSLLAVTDLNSINRNIFGCHEDSLVTLHEQGHIEMRYPSFLAYALVNSRCSLPQGNKEGSYLVQ